MSAFSALHKTTPLNSISVTMVIRIFSSLRASINTLNCVDRAALTLDVLQTALFDDRCRQCHHKPKGR
jgi:hypothetical protein